MCDPCRPASRFSGRLSLTINEVMESRRNPWGQGQPGPALLRTRITAFSPAARSIAAIQAAVTPFAFGEADPAARRGP